MSVLLFQNYGNRHINQFLDSLFGNGKTNKTSKTAKSSGNSSRSNYLDQLQLSPKAQLKSLISEYKKSFASNLNISIKIKADKPMSEASTQSKLSNKADKILRLISKNDEEYNQLKTAFNKAFGEVLGKFDDKPSKEVANSVLEEASISLKQVEAEFAVKNGDRTRVVKYSSYELNMSFSRVESSKADSDKSIAASFSDALASFFGYGTKAKAEASSGSKNTSLSEAQAYFSATSTSTSLTASSSNSANLSASATASSSYMRLQELALKGCDPILLDLSGKGISLTEAGKGANFDINADGKMDSTAWVSGDTAMLVYDKNGNNIIDNGSELFGDQNGASDGFAELAKYDLNKDGKIDSKDSIYKQLKLYRDLNGDGKISAYELSNLPSLGIKALNLSCCECDEKVNGNSIVLRGCFEREDGTLGEMADAVFGYSEL